ncbi:MAG: DUF1440 domain-containing protein [Bacteroidota bacterium]|nr:DUF1440 domain-containing protein [Bacteroidota bacterium]
MPKKEIVPKKDVPQKKEKIFLNILWIGFVVGTLDGIGTILSAYKAGPVIIFQFIASGAFGKATFKGGMPMFWWGVWFHYFIAYSFTAVFYVAYPSFYKFFRNKYLIGLEYGIITWIVMNFIVVPTSKIGFHPIKNVLPILIGISILIICVGMPIALIADFIRRKRLMTQ